MHLHLVRTSYFCSFVLQLLTHMSKPKYLKVQNFLKEKIQQGIYKVGDYLPSENELCMKFSITRTTVRKALDGLMKEGFIEKRHGRGSCVKDRNASLGLLAVKGFSEAVGENVETIFLQKPIKTVWGNEIFSSINLKDKTEECFYFERLRCVDDMPVMLEKNWFTGVALPGFLETEFVEDSFFKTLSQRYFIEVVGSSQELRAEISDSKLAQLLQIETGSPILHISVKFYTTNSKLRIYGELYCNTRDYPIGNSYFL